MRSGRFSVLAAVLFLSAPTAGAVGLIVKPDKLYVTAAPGSTVDHSITITSADGDVDVTAVVEAFTLDDAGLPAHAPSAAAAHLIVPAPAKLHVTAGSAATIRVRVTIPPQATGSAWGVLLLEPRSDGHEPKSRLAVPVFVTAAGTEIRALQTVQVDAAATASGEIRVRARVRNSGNTVIRTTAMFAVEVDDGGQLVEVAAAEHGAFIVLPGSEREIAMSLNGRFEARQRFSAVVMIRYGPGADQILTATADVGGATAGRDLPMRF